MKNVMKMVLTFLLSGSLYASIVPTPLPANYLTHVYSPKGFDSNDNVEVVVEGLLPSLCYSAQKTHVVVKKGRVDIKVHADYRHRKGTGCAQMQIPFIETVSLGIMDKGSYEIFVNGKSLSEVKINENNSDAIDDAVYANVDDIDKHESAGYVILKGYNPSDCFVLDEVVVISNKRDTYSLAPKMKQKSDFCPMKMVPFEINVEIPTELKRDKILLHVRSMDGKSVNSLYRYEN